MININTFLGGFIGCIALECVAVVAAVIVYYVRQRRRGKVVPFPRQQGAAGQKKGNGGAISGKRYCKT